MIKLVCAESAVKTEINQPTFRFLFNQRVSPEITQGLARTLKDPQRRTYGDCWCDVLQVERPSYDPANDVKTLKE